MAAFAPLEYFLIQLLIKNISLGLEIFYSVSFWEWREGLEGGLLGIVSITKPIVFIRKYKLLDHKTNYS